jgi:hypothetical protein
MTMNMNLTAMLRAARGANLDAETRQALVRAARGETGPEIDAALVNALLDDLGVERD